MFILINRILLNNLHNKHLNQQLYIQSKNIPKTTFFPEGNKDEQIIYQDSIAVLKKLNILTLLYI